ncbi:hypothetical protein IC232_04500 [Microvirga sp. BT688]|uniref:hypothetical protein n=1 Tax=Microvirga sp. TaxID=1873136 RepID=UPI00168228C0|nr:hypothetical protein [Microvirga sp.]MBD2745955.1 hypothetical protein [Microvirga sp.]
MKDLTLIDFAEVIRTVTLTDKQCKLLSDCLRFGMDDEVRRAASTVLFDTFHGKEGTFTLTIADWYEVEHAVMCLEGFLQETLSYETFPERHKDFEEIHRLIDGDDSNGVSRYLFGCAQPSMPQAAPEGDSPSCPSGTRTL